MAVVPENIYKTKFEANRTKRIAFKNKSNARLNFYNFELLLLFVLFFKKIFIRCIMIILLEVKDSNPGFFSNPDSELLSTSGNATSGFLTSGLPDYHLCVVL